MDITPLVPTDSQIINRYGDGGFIVNGVSYKGNILIMPDKVIGWSATSIADANPDSLAPLLSGELPEIVLVGVGAQFLPLPEKLRSILHAKHISVDAMDTGAACRTYTVLLAEGRQVAAALIAV